MTNEEKLLKLLQVAVENGWKNDFVKYEDCQYLQHNTSLILENYRGGEDYRQVSLNDLVCNWEEGEISFIDSLCRAVSLTNINAIMILETLTIKIAAERMRSKWCSIPTSQRLDWLFDTFKHLL